MIEILIKEENGKTTMSAEHYHIDKGGVYMDTPNEECMHGNCRQLQTLDRWKCKDCNILLTKPGEWL